MASRPSIYTWKRQENKPVFSSRGNVKEWVKQVQQACDDAAKDIFGDDAQEIFDKRDFYVDDDAILEGQDLIDLWIQKKNVDDLLAECEVQDEVPSLLCAGNRKSSKHHYHHKPNDFNLSNSLHNYYEEENGEVQKQVFDLDDDFDEESAVHEVVYNMLERDVVNFNSVNDERSLKTKTTKFKDPTPKMKLRHEQVRKRATERKIAWEKAHLKKINEKSVEDEARKQLQREEKQRLDNIKREDDEIRKEMVKIRRVMQEESALRAKQHSRDAENEEKAKMLAREEIRKQHEEIEERLKREIETKETTTKKLLKDQEEEVRQREYLKSLKLLQTCFSSWYALVVNKQVKCGKARAILEWRRKLRVWNAWRTYVLRLRSKRETRDFNEEMKDRHRKEVLADRFYRQMLFHRCLMTWLSWVENAKQERMLKEQHDKRAEKMATLLKAASSGQLWQEKNIEEIERGPGCDSHVLKDEQEICLKPFKLPQTHDSESSSKIRRKKETPAREAWPHLKLKEMKTRKPMKKQNAFLENIGSISTRTKSSATTMRSMDSPCRENSSKHETPVTQEQRPSSSNGEDVNLRFQNPRLNALQNNGSNLFQENVVKTDKNIAQVQNTSEPCVALEGYKTPQSTRSISSTSSKSTGMSRKAATKPLRLAMEERAKARAERKSILDAKRRAAEEEKLVKLKQEQEKKEQEILAEKQAALQKKREEMKLAKQRELQKQQRLHEMKEMNRKADEHYHKTLLRYCGFFPWKKLIQTRDEMMTNAEIFHKNHLKSLCFREWLEFTRSECSKRDKLAEHMRKLLLLRFGWQSWKKYRNHLVEMEKIALEFSRRYIIKKYIKIWQNFVIEERLLYWDKENKADEHNDMRLLRKTMAYWKKYIPLLKEEEKREKRRNDLRKHVMSLLPDFQNLNVNHSP